jgi:nucleoside-triphosphatase
MIYILTGDIRTGKTTALLDWSSRRNDVDGLLCPDNENGKRYFLKVKTKEEFLLEVASDVIDQELVAVGPFQFLKSAFENANNFLLALSATTKSRYLILDELGKLELKNKGLHCGATALISNFIYNDSKHLILVIRESLLEEVLKHYKINVYSVLKKEDLGFLG